MGEECKLNGVVGSNRELVCACTACLVTYCIIARSDPLILRENLKANFKN